jgi:hypothetical protein
MLCFPKSDYQQNQVREMLFGEAGKHLGISL